MTPGQESSKLPKMIDYPDIWHSVDIGESKTFILYYHKSQNTDGTLDRNEFEEIGEGFVNQGCIEFNITGHHCCNESQIDQTFEAVKRVYRELIKGK